MDDDPGPVREVPDLGAFKDHLATIAVHNSMHDRQSEPCSVADRLGREHGEANNVRSVAILSLRVQNLYLSSGIPINN
jgi:hypothetical protein